MADLFVSYARADKARVTPLITALEAQGWSVWWDPEIAPGQEFDRLISEELGKARAVVAVWTPTSVASRWVRGEARVAADRGVLAPVRFDGAELPIDLRAIHTTDLDGWSEDAKDPAFRDVVRAIRGLLGEAADPKANGSGKSGKLSVCVLPFANISGDPEQEYFSDGVSEDIITDLSKVSALFVVARNTAFTFKGKSVEVPEIARRLGVSHVLEGSVRKAGNRVRITAQLIDGATGGHVWAERWDRDLTDIFALQDEISQAIVAALKVRLLPEEKKAIEKRGTDNLEAHKLYLMARRYFVGSAISRNELVIRLCQRAVELDPGYAQPWALMATAFSFRAAQSASADDESLSAAETAIRLDPSLAEAHAARGRSLAATRGRYEEAEEEIEIALRLDPQSVESNMAAGTLAMLTRQFERGARHFEIAGNADETDLRGYQMAQQCLAESGDKEAETRVSKALLQRAEKRIAEEPGDGNAYAAGANALASLGDVERARSWTEHAILLEPDDMRMHYNLACTLIKVGDFEKALDLLAIVLEDTGSPMLLWAERDSDLDPLRGLPRFEAIVSQAKARLAAKGADS